MVWKSIADPLLVLASPPPNITPALTGSIAITLSYQHWNVQKLGLVT